jgi:preprotein translocase subunit SecB
MAEELLNGNGGEQPSEMPPVTIAAQYVKDYSFEAPSSPGIFTQASQTEPDLEVNCELSANPLEPNIFEVILLIRSNCKFGDQVAFLQELEYAGVFVINVPSEHLQPVLFIECPRLLFPFARNIIGDGARDGGFPAIMLPYMDFSIMYEQQIAQQTEASQPPLN